MVKFSLPSLSPSVPSCPTESLHPSLSESIKNIYSGIAISIGRCSRFYRIMSSVVITIHKPSIVDINFPIVVCIKLTIARLYNIIYSIIVNQRLAPFLESPSTSQLSETCGKTNVITISLRLIHWHRPRRVLLSYLLSDQL